MKPERKKKCAQAERFDRDFPGDLFIVLNPILNEYAATFHGEEHFYRKSSAAVIQGNNDAIHSLPTDRGRKVLIGSLC